MATTLIAIAGAIFAGIFVVWAMLPSLSSTGQLWAIIVIVLTLIALAASIVFGGRGFMYGPKRADWRDRFNLQAVFGVVAIFLILILAAVIFLTTGAANQNQLENRLKDMNDKIDKLQTNLAAELNAVSSKVSVLSNEVSGAKNKLDAEEKRLDDLGRSSADFSSGLHQIQDSMKSLSNQVDQFQDGMKSLSNQVDQIEKNASQPKQ